MHAITIKELIAQRDKMQLECNKCYCPRKARRIKCLDLKITKRRIKAIKHFSTPSRIRTDRKYQS